MLARALVLGALGAGAALLAGSPQAALGAVAGSVAAGLYVSAYLHSHLGTAGRVRALDRRVAGAAGLRLALSGLGGLAAYSAGRTVLLFYLASFAIALLVLVVGEIPRARRDFQSGGAL